MSASNSENASAGLVMAEDGERDVEGRCMEVVIGTKAYEHAFSEDKTNSFSLGLDKNECMGVYGSKEAEESLVLNDNLFLESLMRPVLRIGAPLQCILVTNV